MGRQRMIPVRHRDTGLETLVGESAFPYFAAHYERLDEIAPALVQPNKPSMRRAAAKTEEE
jgi:hypothetical protein